ncbi:TPA: hypothetical protein GF206_23605 [Escherichia coli]|nr:hypothetical protein [Escherichia coli]
MIRIQHVATCLVPPLPLRHSPYCPDPVFACDYLDLCVYSYIYDDDDADDDDAAAMALALLPRP